MTKTIWYLYILRCGDGSLYTGITTDVQARLAQHQSGKGAKYTRGRGPLKVVYVEELETKSQALKREIAIKTLPREQKEKLINRNDGCAEENGRGEDNGENRLSEDSVAEKDCTGGDCGGSIDLRPIA